MRVFILLLFSLILAQDRSAVVTGFCYLEDETDHSGVEVTFDAVSGSAVTQSVFTEADGSYIAALPEGIYIVSLSKDGFIPLTLPGEINFFEDTELEPITLLAGSVMEVSGTLDGNTTWTNDFQYWITDGLVLNSGDTLTIESGVDILFKGHFEFMVYGVLYALGAEQDSIRFTSGQSQKNKGDWRFIEFHGNGADGSYLSHTIVEYGGTNGTSFPLANIRGTHGASVVIEHSKIHNSNNHGIFVEHLDTEVIINYSQIFN